jgi:hypothetical protein
MTHSFGKTKAIFMKFVAARAWCVSRKSTLFLRHVGAAGAAADSCAHAPLFS